jgi:hypothetical protein
MLDENEDDECNLRVKGMKVGRHSVLEFADVLEAEVPEVVVGTFRYLGGGKSGSYESRVAGGIVVLPELQVLERLYNRSQTLKCGTKQVLVDPRAILLPSESVAVHQSCRQRSWDELSF